MGDKEVIRNIHSWVNKNSKIDINVYSQNNEIIIEVPEENIAVRYFVPGKVPVVTPYNNITRLKTKALHRGLSRQIIFRSDDSIQISAQNQKKVSKTGFTKEDRRHVERLYDFAIEGIRSGKLDSELPVVASIVDGQGRIVNTVTRQKYDSDNIEMLKEKLGADTIEVNANGNLMIGLKDSKRIIIKKNDQDLSEGKKKLVEIKNKFYWVSYKSGKYKFRTRYGVGARHAEMQAIKQAEKAGFNVWENATLYINLSSCQNCNKAIAEFYGVKKVVYISLDETLLEVENERARMICKRNNVELVACPDNDIVRKNRTLFKPLNDKIDKRGGRIPLTQEVLERDYRDGNEFRKKYQQLFGEDVQVTIFDADIWDKNRKEEVLLRNIEWVAQNRNPEKQLVLLLVGSEENCRAARKKIIEEKVFSERKEVPGSFNYNKDDIIIYSRDNMPSETTEYPGLDMHMHSDISDGEDSPEEIILKARGKGLRAISITDHDTMEAYSPEIFKYARDNAVELVPGVEISTINQNELYPDGYNFTDVIGLFPQKKDDNLGLHLTRINKINKRLEQQRNIFKGVVLSTFLKLKEEYQEKYLDLNFGELLDGVLSEGVYQELNEKVIDKARLCSEEADKYIKEKISKYDFLEALPDSFSDFNPVLNYFLKKIHQRDLPEKVNGPSSLMMYILNNKNYYFSSSSPENLSVLDIRDAIALIQGNGGIAILAHPLYEKTFLGSESYEAWFKEIVDIGLDGIEAFSKEHTGVDSLYFYSLAKKYGLMTTNASDYHGLNNKPGREMGTGYGDVSGNQTSFDMIVDLEERGVISRQTKYEIFEDNRQRLKEKKEKSEIETKAEKLKALSLVEDINKTKAYDQVKVIREKLLKTKQREKLDNFEDLLYKTNSLPKGDGWKAIDELDGKILVNEELGFIDYSSEEPVIEAEIDLIGARHGKTYGNDWKVLQGQQDITDEKNTGLNQLNDNGHEQAKISADSLWETLGPKIRKGEDVVVVTSNLSRSKQTAQYFIDKVKKETGLDLVSVEEEDATEISFGVCGNTPYIEPTEEIRRKLTEAGISTEAMSSENEEMRQVWLGGNAVIKFEGGESFVDVLIRTKRLIEKLNRKYKGKIVVLVGHGTQLTAMRILLRKDVVTNIDDAGNVHLMWRNKHPVKGNVELDNSEVEQLAFGADRRKIKNKPEKKVLFGKDKIFSPEQLLPQLEDFPFPGREKQGESLRFVIETEMPNEDYYLMKLDPEKYTKEVYDLHYKIAMAGWRGSKVVLEEVLPVDILVELFSKEENSFIAGINMKKYYSINGEAKTREKIIELDLVKKYIKEHGRKKAKFKMMNSVWGKTGAIDLLPRSLMGHAMDEWEIITKLLIGDPSFKGVLGIPRKDVVPIMSLYREFFGDEFNGLTENVQAMNFMSQFLLLHDIGKYIEGDKGHEQRSKKLLEEIFKSDYFGFNESEKHLIRTLSGIHTEIEDLNRDKNTMEKVQSLIGEAVRGGFFKENELVDIIRVFTVFRMAEQLQAADFGFAERADFEVWRDMYDTIKSIIHKEFLKGTKENSTVPNYSQYLNVNEPALNRVLTDNKQGVLLRVPIEVIEQINEDNVHAFLEAFNSFPNAYVRLFYMSGIDEDVSESVYGKYSIEKKDLPKGFDVSRENTITLLPVFKEDTITDMTIISRLGASNIKATDTILSPVGLLHDSSGLVRATIFGLRIIALTGDISKNDLNNLRKDPAFMGTLQRDVLEVYKQICDPEYQNDLAGLDLEDIIGLAIGNINEVVKALKKLVKLIPISPIDPEQLRHIFENARKVLLAA